MSVYHHPEGPRDPDLDDAIWKTIAYAGLFQYPLRLDELCRRLMDVEATEQQIAACLGGASLASRVRFDGGFIHPRGSEDWILRRQSRGEHTRRLLARHDRALTALAAFPFVRMVALSGACAHGNATDDDVDVFLVTCRARLWLTTLLLMAASKAAGLRRSLCINYIVAEDGLALPERDRFTAAEIVALQPLAGRTVYRRFVEANRWGAPLHPNFFKAYAAESERVAEDVGSPRVEALLDAMGAAGLERLARRALEPYLRRRVIGDGVALTDQRLKLHGHDHRPSVSRAFDAEVGPSAPPPPPNSPAGAREVA
jgi:hypothetical protein